MADITNNTINAYLKNRLKYHAASRLASQTGEGLAQAMNVDGHTVTTAKVWAAPQSYFPNNLDKDNVDAIDATNDLVAVFKTSVLLSDGSMSVVEEQEFWAADKNGNKNGKVWTNTAYPAVKLYENVPMTAVKGSDGGGKFQSFEILAAEDGYSEGTLRVSDWIAPTAVADRTTGKVVAGFSGIPMYSGDALTKDTSRWAATLGTWEFVYIAGMLTFEPGYTPENKDTTAVDPKTLKSVITLTAFKYDGEYLDSSINTTKADITTISGTTIPAIEADITTISGTTIPAIEADIASLKITAAENELFTGTISIPAVSGDISPVTVDINGDDSQSISGSVSAEGIVTLTVPGEVIAVKQQIGTSGSIEEIYPDMVFTDSTTETFASTVLTADYGYSLSEDVKVLNISAETAWIITFRAIPKKKA